LFIAFEKGLRLNIFKKKTLTLLIVLTVTLMGTGSVNAQETITLDKAIALAVQNNQNLKTENLRADYAKAIIKTSADIPQASITADYGQINSAYKDTKFGVAQNIAFPTVYKRQKEVFTEEWKYSLLNVSLKEFELKKAVTQTFYNILFWQEKEKLLLKANSLYADFYARSLLRLQKGESNVLEKTTAQNQKAAINIQLKQVQQELEKAKLQWQWLLNSDTVYKVESSEKILPLQVNETNKNPVLEVLAQQKNIAASQTKVEKSKLLPGLMIGYNLNSFKGTGADDKLYNASPQFHSVQVGVSIPVFSQAQRARVNASKITESITENQLQATGAYLQNRYKQFLESYRSNLEIVNYYENEGLKSADVVTETIQKQFVNGEINYLDFVILINQAINIQSNYADAVKALNDTIIQINYIN